MPPANFPNPFGNGLRQWTKMWVMLSPLEEGWGEEAPAEPLSTAPFQAVTASSPWPSPPEEEREPAPS